MAGVLIGMAGSIGVNPALASDSLIALGRRMSCVAFVHAVERHLLVG
jgi:hypothetical protein